MDTPIRPDDPAVDAALFPHLPERSFGSAFARLDMTLRKDPLARVLLRADEEHFGRCTLPADDDGPGLMDCWHSRKRLQQATGWSVAGVPRIW